MVETDLSDYFGQLCKESEWSLQKIQEAKESNSIRSRAETAATKPGGSEVTDDRQSAHAARDKGADHWEEFRDQWRAHVAKVKADTSKKLAELDATGAANNAREAESDAQNAIGHALEAIEEAERSVVYALGARASAEELASEAAARR
ncbi:hypothetical protein [Mycobacterium sp.]|uniref:hypothetical protein n=1 Tax=Mycobacterium sp. TaxID=1785 RepID=UPI002CA2BDCE|nr:hypothetical protein [Mycobacterium sp.]HTY35086.1 hypothetical protein [Mycobacterium sp.]